MPRARHRIGFQLDTSKPEGDADAADWLYGFDESALDGAGVPDKYRKVVGETVVEMTETEKVDIERPILKNTVQSKTRALAEADAIAKFDIADSGRGQALLDSLDAATTLAELAAVEDSR
ncbi:hypothetical protein LCGC14_0424650 [marine sediment metagenome]|uniref:Uncharacterized protein n=1 Tax=marine sediment metagenome TaxID=412755 RepID=A0A0F9VZ53_9ZZZZ